jgi:hypothetical protein
MFKLLSKIVHPTAYIVNSGQVIGDAELRDLLLIHFQRYVLDSLMRVKNIIGIPEELTTRWFASGKA